MVVQSQFIEQFSDERWPLKSISELCDIVTDGEHQTPRRVDSGIYLLSARNVKNQELSFDDVDYIDEQEYQRIAKRIEPQENDVLISCSGSVGRTCVVPKGIRFQLVRSVALLRFKPLVDPLFMSYQMAMPYVQSQIETLKSQTSQANLFQGNIKKIQVIVPSKEEQKRFIIVVRKADKSKFDGLKSQFIEMSKHGCSKRQLGSLFCSIRNGANIKQGVKSGGFPITRIETIAEGYVDRSKMGYAGIEDNSYSGYYLQNYDILMSHINSMKHIGKTAIYRQSIGETVIHGMNLLCLRLKEGVANPMYVLYLLQSDDIRTEIRLISKQAVNQASFTVSDLKTIEITLPSMSVQNQFEVVVNQADKSKYLS